MNPFASALPFPTPGFPNHSPLGFPLSSACRPASNLPSFPDTKSKTSVCASPEYLAVNLNEIFFSGLSNTRYVIPPSEPLSEGIPRLMLVELSLTLTRSLLILLFGDGGICNEEDNENTRTIDTRTLTTRVMITSILFMELISLPLAFNFSSKYRFWRTDY